MRLIHLNSLIIWLLGAAAPLVAGPSTAPSVRVALVIGAGGEALGNLADVIVGNLRSDQRMQLLERQDVRPALTEQAIASDGLSDPARAVAVGQLLSVEVFAVLDNQAAGAALVIYDCRTGARLADQILGGKTVEERAAIASTSLRAAIVKQHDLTHPVCLLTVRNADLGSSMDCFCDGIGQIFQRRLLMSKEVTVLERQYLDQVNKERLLPTSRPAMPLLPSLDFIELQISRGKQPGRYSAGVFLSDSNGSKLGRVDASAGDPETLIEQMIDRLVDKLGATRTNTAPSISFGFPRGRAGRISKLTPSSPPSARSSMTPC